jgi:hypothetical protein
MLATTTILITDISFVDELKDPEKTDLFQCMISTLARFVKAGCSFN